MATNYRERSDTWKERAATAVWVAMKAKTKIGFVRNT